MNRDFKKMASLGNEIYALCEVYGLSGEETIAAMAYSAARVMNEDAPDCKTAHDWRIALNAAVHSYVAEAAASGVAVWSQSRMH